MAERVRETAADWLLGQDITAARDPVTSRAEKEAEARLNRCRAALGGRPDPSLDTLSWRWTFEASRTQRFVFLVRCLDRVWPLVAAHDRLGPFARPALVAGVECCLGRPPADTAVVLTAWAGLTETLNDLLPAEGSGDPTLTGTGAGHAALVTAAVIRALAKPDDPGVAFLCRAAAEDASVAFGAAAPEPFRSRDAARLTQAVAKDLNTLYDRSHLEDPTDPDEAGPYGRLWVREPYFLELAVLCAEAAALVRALTRPAGSPTLADVAGRDVARAGAGGDETGLAGLRPPPAEAETGSPSPSRPDAADPGLKPLYPTLDLARIRERMKEIVREKGLTLHQVGTALGASDEKAATNAAYYLLNNSRKLSLDDIVLFCNLTRTPLDSLILSSEDPR